MAKKSQKSSSLSYFVWEMLIGPIQVEVLSRFRVLVLGGGGKKRMTNEPLICIDRFAKWAAAASDDNVETN